MRKSRSTRPYSMWKCGTCSLSVSIWRHTGRKHLIRSTTSRVRREAYFLKMNASAIYMKRAGEMHSLNSGHSDLNGGKCSGKSEIFLKSDLQCWNLRLKSDSST